MVKLFGAPNRRAVPANGTATPARSSPGAVPSKLDYLSVTDIFRDLTPEELAELAQTVTHTTCRSGRVFYTPGATGEVLFILKQGRVSIYRIASDGRKLITATLGPGTVFGEMWLTGQGMRGSFAEAVEDCTLCVMGRGDVERLLADEPRVALRLLQLMAARLQAADERQEMLAFQDVTGRLAETLLQLAGEERRVVVGVTHQELGEMVGAYRETATRILNGLHSQGLIELQRRRIRILDAETLRDVADQYGVRAVAAV